MKEVSLGVFGKSRVSGSGDPELAKDSKRLLNNNR